MAKRKTISKIATFTRKQLIDKMNNLRSRVDRTILNLLYNPNSNNEVIKEMREIQKITQGLPFMYIQPGLFTTEEEKEKEKEVAGTA